MTELEHHPDCDGTCEEKEVMVLSEEGEMEIINAFTAYVKHGSYPPPSVTDEEELRALCAWVGHAADTGAEVDELADKANFTPLRRGEFLLLTATLALAMRLHDMPLMVAITEQFERSGIAAAVEPFVEIDDDAVQSAQDAIREVMSSIEPDGLLELPPFGDEEDES